MVYPSADGILKLMLTVMRQIGQKKTPEKCDMTNSYLKPNGIRQGTRCRLPIDVKKKFMSSDALRLRELVQGERYKCRSEIRHESASFLSLNDP